MHLDPSFQEFSLIFLFLFIAGGISKLVNIPNAVGFLISGVLIGPSGFGIVDQSSAINQVGSAGVVLLLFFLGMELSPKEMIKEWKITLLGTVLQISLSTGCVLLLGEYLDWPLNRSILLGFVISLSSTVMVIQVLNDRNILKTQLGKDTLGILIAQDLFVVPMLIIIGLLGDKKLDSTQITKQVIGGCLLTALLLTTPYLRKIKFSFMKKFRADFELSLLFCLSFAFGLSLLSGLMELSTALGAFVAGNMITQLKLGEVFHHSLLSFKVVLTAIFFSSIGLLLDFQFFVNNFSIIFALTILALTTNTVVNSIIFRLLGRSWKNSILASSFLAQVGEFSFILAAIGLQDGVINNFSYQNTIFVIFFSIVLTPLWVKLASSLTNDKVIN